MYAEISLAIFMQYYENVFSKYFRVYEIISKYYGNIIETLLGKINWNIYIYHKTYHEILLIIFQSLSTFYRYPFLLVTGWDVIDVH